MSVVRCRACKEFIDKDEAIKLPLGHVCDGDCLGLLFSKQKAAKKRVGKDSIPPEIRKQVRYRDGDACRFCRNVRHTECHHLVYRSQGGPHAMSNLIVLCGEHHRMVHSHPYWRPILLAMLEEQEKTGQFFLAPAFEKIYNDRCQRLYGAGS